MAAPIWGQPQAEEVWFDYDQAQPLAITFAATVGFGVGIIGMVVETSTDEGSKTIRFCREK